jgi:ABC-type Zn uptake system ZnuABC Zn-binding protein ZnuA
MSVKEIVTYHRSWSYLAAAFGVEVAAEVEPLPGIPPTGRHLQELVTIIREHEIPILLYEPYFSDEAGDFLERETGIRVVKASPSCDGVEPESYLEHIERLIRTFAESSS